MPTKKIIPKTISEQTKITITLSSGEKLRLPNIDVNPFLDTIEHKLIHKEVLKYVQGNSVTFINCSCIEKVEVKGRGITPAATQ